VLGDSGKWFDFALHGHFGFDDFEETGGMFFSIPQWQTPLQHGHEQWLEAADKNFQPLLLVNG
jgi:hypothetical protein